MAYNICQFSSVSQSCPPLCDPMDCSTPGFPVHHQLLELAQICVDIYIYIYIVIYVRIRGERSHIGLSTCVLSHVWLFVAPQTVARQAPLSMEFSRQEYWSRLPFPTLGDLPNPGMEPTTLCLLHWQVDSLPLVPPGKAIAQNNTKLLWNGLNIPANPSQSSPVLE